MHSKIENEINVEGGFHNDNEIQSWELKHIPLKLKTHVWNLKCEEKVVAL